MIKRRKIAYISGARADSGLMTSVLKAIDRDQNLKLQTYATGMHLMKKFGRTVNLVKRDFPQTKIINAVFESDKKESVVRFISKLSKGIIDVFSKDRPDFVLTLGDRPEMLCTAMACLYLGIPTGQLHAGDRTHTVDEPARHSITKMSHVLFAATNKAAQRLKRMGEDEWRIHVVGAPGLDIINNSDLPKREEIYSFLKLNRNDKFILVTQHPISENVEESDSQMNEIIEALKSFSIPVIVIYPNADPGGRKMIKSIGNIRKNKNFRIFPNVDYRLFLGLEREASAWVGNSSAGVIESASFKTPVVNVGIRQIGRQHGVNVIHVDCHKKQIELAVSKSLFDPEYLKVLRRIKNPWGDGKTGEKVVKVIRELEINNRLLTKQIAY